MASLTLIFCAARWALHWLPLAFVILSCCLPVGAQEKSSADDTPNKSADSATLARMRRRAQSLVMHNTAPADSAAVALQDEPLLHYTDPGGITTDATIWAWGKTGRPLALAAIFYEKLSSGKEKWSCELTALADEEVRVESKTGWRWMPRNSDIEWQAAPGESEPGQTPRQRARQMNELARRFSVSETFSEERTDQLRLMPRALYRYADPEQGLMDGALYAFANGTNPEALLLVEARTAPERAVWHYGFARLGAAQLQATLDDKPVWRRPGIVRWNANEAYYSVFGPDGEVFPSTLNAEASIDKEPNE
jgi:hypothetical protein